MRRTDELIAEQLAEWGYMPFALVEVFSSDPTPEAIGAGVDAWCRQAFGTGPVHAEFFTASVGSVYGLRLADGRRVVVKIHPPRASPRYLEAMQTVQHVLVEAGFQAPAPLVAPAPLERGIAVAETLLETGDPADAHDPVVRRAMATSLAWLVALCRPMTELTALRESIMAVRPGELWPTPHDRRFDFGATTAGAEWLDEIAARARRVRDGGAGDVVVGHTDWRPENMRFISDGSVSAVYDWDSLAVLREPVLVGAVAHLFTSDFRVPDRVQIPTLDEALAFITDYEAARGAPFGREEHAAARAALIYAMAYTARCEHSDLLTDMGRAPARPERTAEPVPPGSARAFVSTHGDALLGRAVSSGDA